MAELLTANNHDQGWRWLVRPCRLWADCADPHCYGRGGAGPFDEVTHLVGWPKPECRDNVTALPTDRAVAEARRRVWGSDIEQAAAQADRAAGGVAE